VECAAEVDEKDLATHICSLRYVSLSMSQQWPT
jgi:hypothetical protein